MAFLIYHCYAVNVMFWSQPLVPIKKTPKKVSLQSGDGFGQNGTYCLPAWLSASRVGL